MADTHNLDKKYINPKALERVTNYADIVFCIGISSSMENFLPKIKHAICTFYDSIYQNKGNPKYRFPDQLRIKIIGFGSTEQSPESILLESEFFLIPQQLETLSAFLNNIATTGNEGVKDNALNALTAAMRSDWCQIKDAAIERARHVIVVISDKVALPIEELIRNESLTHNLGSKPPQSYEELYLAWSNQIDGHPHLRPYTMDHLAQRLVCFVPENGYPWCDIAEEFDYAAVIPISEEIFTDTEWSFLNVTKSAAM